MKKAACILAWLLLPAVAFGQSQKLGVVNIRDILDQSQTAHAVSQALQEEFGPQQAVLVEAERRYKDKRAAFERDSVIMAEAERTQAERELSSLMRDLQSKQAEFSETFGYRQQEEMQKFMANVKSVVDTYAEKEHYDMILPSDASIYFGSAVDITPAVLNALDRG